MAAHQDPKHTPIQPQDPPDPCAPSGSYELTLADAQACTVERALDTASSAHEEMHQAQVRAFTTIEMANEAARKNVETSLHLAEVVNQVATRMREAASTLDQLHRAPAKTVPEIAGEVAQALIKQIGEVWQLKLGGGRSEPDLLALLGKLAETLTRQGPGQDQLALLGKLVETLTRQGPGGQEAPSPDSGGSAVPEPSADPDQAGSPQEPPVPGTPERR